MGNHEDLPDTSHIDAKSSLDVQRALVITTLFVTKDFAVNSNLPL